ncbi:MAG TPA: hypothetical protein VG477_00580 [Thermoanaerobaculia bacterium]|nr:hypothetical protein [Thermoanaerobaculia bacterium]
MKKIRMTCDSALLLAYRRVALLEARLAELEAGGGKRPAGEATRPDELTKALWTFAVLIVFMVLAMVGLMVWGTAV